MAVDPSGRTMFKNEAELSKFHEGLAKLDKEISIVGVVGSALNGAALGAMLGFAVHYKDRGHREIGKHALYGAAITGSIAAIGYMLGKSMSFAGHFVESEARRELRGQPTRAELAMPLPTDRHGAVATSGYATGWYDRWGRWHHHHRPQVEEPIEQLVGQGSAPVPMPPPPGPTVDCPAGMAWDPVHNYCLPTAVQPLPPPVHHTAYYGGSPYGY